MSKNVVDQAVRQELLDPKGSFIVQAPAGSGKTELLTQRILALLAVVEKPENILAITFTRKAAAEMQHRVVSALILAQGEEPQAAHEKHRWQLARQVLLRDQQKGWKLLENASRLNMTTIDSLCSSLSGALPLLSQTGALPSIVENAMPYYQQAADNLLESISDKDEIAEHILALLAHKDNNLMQVSDLLAQLLAKRLQWMTSISQHVGQFDQQSLLHSLEQVIEEKLVEVYQSLPLDIVSELPALLNQAAQVLRKSDKPNKPNLQQLEHVDAITSPKFKDLMLWKAIAELFLKAGNKPDFLTSFTKTSGFPVEKDGIDVDEKLVFKHNKVLVKEIATQLAQMPGMGELFVQLKSLPPTIEQSVSQPGLKAAMALLPMALSHLKLVFSRYNVIDFSELSLASIAALGHTDMPSDLALALDYRLEHILIDEFQDTSTPQIKLLQLLTAGWDGSSDRTLFLVGDPMQSIYRFRDANVSLFMKIRENGIGQVFPEFRQLKVNFRSNGVIVDWVNQEFERIMPSKDDHTFSAVSYAHSVAFHLPVSTATVNCNLTIDAEDHLAQAGYAVAIIKKHLAENQQNNTHKSLAVLARSRAHLSEIIQYLNQQNIEFQALEIDRLSQKMVVRDLLSLAFALCDTYDHLSWAACMRAPWFALKLEDIRQIMLNSEPHLPLIERIAASFDTLSPESLARCQKLLPILNAALEQKGRKPFKKWLLGCFKAVGAMAQLDLESDKDDLMVCLDKLSELQEGGELNDRALVDDAIDRLFAAPNPKADGQVQVMTIHKSKGLEFDRVILPRLDSIGRSSDQPLLNWSEVVDQYGEPHNLLAISKQTGEQSDGVYQYIAYLESQKSKFENQRVLYVAATRAKQELHLLGNVNSDPKTGEAKAPSSGSFLGLLWKGVKDSFETIELKHGAAEPKHKQDYSLFSRRWIKQVALSAATEVPAAMLDEGQNNLAEQLDALAQGSTPQSVAAIAIGNLLHRQLQWLSEHYNESFSLPENWRAVTQAQLKATWAFSSDEEIEDAADKILLGLNNTLTDEFGKTLLSAQKESASELVMHKKIDNNAFLTRVIDRTFVKDDVRWIIDYKSATPQAGESLTDFLVKEKQLYLQQLSDYFKMFATLEKRKIIAGLYFPMLAHFELVIEN